MLMLVLMSTQFSRSKLRHKHKQKHKKNELVRFSCAYALMLMSTPFSLVYTCTRAYAYASLCLRANENQALENTMH